MNRKVILSLTVVIFLAIWAAALIVLLGYSGDPTPARALVFGVLILAAPLVLLVGFSPIWLGVRSDIHKRSTELRNVEHKLSNAQASLATVETQIAEQAAKAEDNDSHLSAIRENLGLLQTSLAQTDKRVSTMTTQLNDLKSDAVQHDTNVSRLQDEVTQQGTSVGRLDKKVSQIGKQAVVKASESAGLPAKEIAALVHEAEAATVRLAAFRDVPLAALFTGSQASNYLSQAADRQDYLAALPIVREFPGAADGLTLTQCRTLMKGIRQLGYLEETAILMKAVAAKSGKENDAEKAVLFQSEFEMYQGFSHLEVELPDFEDDLDSTTVLHFVGKALPETQTGYTLRTHYTVEAQQRMGINPVVVAQSGASPRAHDLTETYVYKGIRYYLLGGPQRNTVPWDQWLAANIRELAETVRQVRPAVLHTHSDFLNAVIVQFVGDTYGIPVVNETRGFWEESWLSRKANLEGWHDLEQIEQLYGLPTAYTLRKERELEYRSKASAVVTLANVMQDHIEELANDYAKPVERVAIVPNAVESDAFPVPARNSDLVEELGIPEGAAVIGYISSIVEYEGIDILVRAFFELLSTLEVVKDFPSFVLDESAIGDAVEEQEPETVYEKEQRSDLDEAFALGALGEEKSERTSATGAEPTVASSVEKFRSSLESSAAVFSSKRMASAPRTDQYGGDAASEISGHELNRMAQDALTKRLARVHPDLDGLELKERAAELLAVARNMSWDEPVHLLIVGDGVELAGLGVLASDLEITDSVTFTGRVPHEQVLDYYSIIDLFVVPRRPSTVTELVTPLKPFEAMSTGRPCVFSNVGALSEIASQSGAAVTFKAGDHHDLAITMCHLLGDPEELARMSEQGAAWVRDARTWDLNSAKYLDVYNSLGLKVEMPDWVRIAEEMKADGLQPGQLIRQIAASPTPQPTGWFTLDTNHQTAEEIMRDGWRFANHPPVKFEEDLDWAEAGRSDRSWGFHLHTWEFIDPVLKEFHKTGDENLLRWMLDLAQDWWDFASGEISEDAMVWYDMALSLRMPRLARLLLAAAEYPWRDEVFKLLQSAIAHVDACMSPEAFNQNNNHGFFAAAAALDFSKLLPMMPKSKALHELGSERMTLMASNQFADDGGHLEHSPDYHRMLLSSFESALNAGLIDDDQTRERIKHAAHVMGWMVQPDGKLVQFGDTPSFDVDAEGLESTDPYSEFILTDGVKGIPNDIELLALPDSGFAFVRSPQPQGLAERINSSYLAFQAGFHSRAHKHADDLTFTWFDRGCELIVDSGRYGYIDLLPSDSPDRLKGFYYSDPKRQYVESTRAHNTVEVDGTDIDRRAREPYGSGLRHCDESEGSFVLRGEADHNQYLHQRTLKLIPATELEITDSLESLKGRIEAIAWFNLDGNLEVEVSGNDLVVTLPGDRGVMTVQSSGELVTPVRGQEVPMRGWRSRIDRETEAVWNFGFRLDVENKERLVTTFKFLEAQNR